MMSYQWEGVDKADTLLICKRIKQSLGFSGLVNTHFKPNAVTDQCDKFRIGWLALMVIDGVAE